jgi:HAD superfamily hydrolase (TIGR01509 family)
MSATKQDLFEAGLVSQGVPACPGAVELLRASASVVPIAVCSGSPKRTVEALLVALGVRDLLKVVVSLNDVSRGKPDPEPYLMTAQRMGFDPIDCIAIEDTPAGVRSAIAAGLRVVAVGHSVPASKLSEAHAFVRHIADLSVDDLLTA